MANNKLNKSFLMKNANDTTKVAHVIRHPFTCQHPAILLYSLANLGECNASHYWKQLTLSVAHWMLLRSAVFWQSLVDVILGDDTPLLILWGSYLAPFLYNVLSKY